MRRDPSELITPVRPMGKIAIQREALAVLAKLFPEGLETPCAVPILRFLEEDLEFEYNMRFVVRSSTWPTEGGARPKEHPDGAGIALDQDRFNLLRRDNRRARFTAAHEFGHVLLHLDQLRVAWQGDLPYFAGLIPRGKLCKPYMDPEWQADTFANQLLLPEPMLKRVISLGWSEFRIADVFKISRSALDIRLNFPRAA